MDITKLQTGDLVVVRVKDCGCCFTRDSFPRSGKEALAEVVSTSETEAILLINKGYNYNNSAKILPLLNLPNSKKLQHNAAKFAAKSIVRKVAGQW